jgi:hypothetical protein
MRKIALFVALAMVAASPAMAAKKKAKPAEPAMTEAQKTNDASYRLVRDSLPMWLPSWAQPVYQYGVKGVDAPPDTAKPAKKKSKRPS